MRAAVISEMGTAPVLADVPEPASGAAIGKVLAAAITPIDHVVATGAWGKLPLPFVTGKEGVAELDGRRVYFEVTPMKGGACAERIALTENDFIVEIPSTMDVRQAAGLGGSTGITAWMALEWTAKIQPGETVLILGATGLVGTTAVQIAKILGAACVVAAGRSVAGLERARAAGADAVVNATDEKDRLTEAFIEATNGGPHVIFDPVSGTIAQCALGAARRGARFVQIGRASGEGIVVPPALVPKSLTIAGYANFSAPPDVRKQTYRKILHNIMQGTLHAAVDPHSLDDVAEAWESSKRPDHAKILVEP
jgi:NADPH:quinone reductase-like Zn-dependent oxidoreductase